MLIRCGLTLAYECPAEMPMMLMNRPRIGRILMARGRDAADIAILTAFGAANLASARPHKALAFRTA
jgi:hypothetical protein